jgi:hypothetical protein
MKTREEVLGISVVSGGQAAELFDPFEEAFDQVSR